jgi:hypothetical protein
VDLKGDVPVLSNLSQSQLCEISLQRLGYAATSTLNVPLPGLRLYLGPDGVTDPREPAAHLVGTIPAISAGSSTSGNVISEPDFSQTFTAFARVLGTRFMLMTAATVALTALATEDDYRRSLAAGFQMHFTLPGTVGARLLQEARRARPLTRRALEDRSGEALPTQ